MSIIFTFIGFFAVAIAATFAVNEVLTNLVKPFLKSKIKRPPENNRRLRAEAKKRIGQKRVRLIHTKPLRQ